MIVKLYSIKDEMTEFSVQLTPFVEEPTAKRWFRDTVKSNQLMRDNPEDFSLWEVGNFDSKTGQLEHLPFPQLIEKAKGADHGNEEITL